MSKINLLPWREELKKIRNRRFFAVSGSVVLVGILTVYILHLLFSYRIHIENANIDYLNHELQVLNQEISQIQGLQESKDNLLRRMRIIQALQKNRSSIVKLLDILPRVVPEGIYLTSISRTEPELEVIKKQYQVAINGVAETNSEISNFMKNLQKISWVSDIKYSEVSIHKTGEGLNFKLEFNQKIEG